MVCLAAVLLAVIGACDSPSPAGASGAACLQATDCQEGLVCVPQPSGALICSSDLGPIELSEEAGVSDASYDARASDGATDGGPEASSPSATDAAAADGSAALLLEAASEDAAGGGADDATTPGDASAVDDAPSAPDAASD